MNLCKTIVFFSHCPCWKIKQYYNDNFILFSQHFLHSEDDPFPALSHDTLTPTVKGRTLESAQSRWMKPKRLGNLLYHKLSQSLVLNGNIIFTYGGYNHLTKYKYYLILWMRMYLAYQQHYTDNLVLNLVYWCYIYSYICHSFILLLFIRSNSQCPVISNKQLIFKQGKHGSDTGRNYVYCKWIQKLQIYLTNKCTPAVWRKSI